LCGLCCLKYSQETKKHNHRLLKTSLKFLSSIAVISITSEFILKNILTKLLLGDRFSDQGNILIFATLYQITLASIVLYAFYLLIIRSRRSLILALSVMVSCMVLSFILRKYTADDY